MEQDRNALKVQVLLNKVNTLENENAELRVELHYLTLQLQELKNNEEKMSAPDEVSTNIEDPDAPN